MAKATRQQVWRHNGFFGSVSMAISAMNAIMDYPTTTYESRVIAGQTKQHLERLRTSLKTRRR